MAPKPKPRCLVIGGSALSISSADVDVTVGQTGHSTIAADRRKQEKLPKFSCLKALCSGSQFTGTFCARELKKKFYVTVVDAKEYFEYTPGRMGRISSFACTLPPVD